MLAANVSGQGTSSTGSGSRTGGTAAPGGEPLLEVGRIVKPHGLQGEVVVVLVTDRSERLAPGTVLRSAAGLLTVVASRPHQARFLVRFEGVTSREQADGLRATVLSAAGIDDPDALWVHDLIGARAVLSDGTPCGIVRAVQANPADDLLVLSSGALVPSRFVQGFDDERRLLLDVPEGLLDL